MAYLPMDRQKEIDAKIDAIKLDTDLTYPEHSILDIINRMGLEVYITELEDKVKGAIRYPQENELGSKPKIFVNSKYSKEGRTFTLAHELGHFLLHDGENKWRIDSIDYTNPDTRPETEANYFAASFLMPKDKLKKLLTLTRGENLEAIADYFGVSMPALENRIKWLQNRTKERGVILLLD